MSHVPRTPSVESQRVVRMMRRLVRPTLSRLPANRLGVTALRLASAGMRLPIADRAPPARTVRYAVPGGSIGGDWAWPQPRRREGRGVVLYLPGGAFVASSRRVYRGMGAVLASSTRLPVFVLHYRLAPEHPFTAAADDALAAYRALIDRGWSPDEIVVVGDSAGAHLGLDLVFELARRGQPRPRALVLFSPLIQVDFPGAEAVDRRVVDPMSDAAAARRLMRLYVGQHDPRDPRLDLLRNDLSLLPPTLVQVGEYEMLSDQARRFTDAATAAGAEVELQCWRGQFHVFQAYTDLIPEAREALTASATWIVERLSSAGQPQMPSALSDAA